MIGKGMKMDIIDQMIRYVSERDNSILLTDSSIMSVKDLSGVVIRILSWLRREYRVWLWISQGRDGGYKLLEVNPKDSWYGNLKMLLEQNEAFSSNFAIKDGKFCFSDSVSEKDRMIAREKVYLWF